MSTEHKTEGETQTRSVRQRYIPEWIWTEAPLFVIVALFMSPIVLAMVMSTQSTVAIYQTYNFLPGTEALENYSAVLFEFNFATYMVNSFIMATVIVIGKLTFSLLAALAIVYYDFRFKNVVFMIILFTLLLPIPVRIIPLYQFMIDLGWANSFAGLTGPYIASATAVFLFRQHFKSLPTSILETAKLDGVGPLKFLIYVLMPMSRGMIVGVIVIMFISSWNKYLWPLVVISDQQSQVVQVGIRYIQGTAAGGLTQWGIIMAGSIVALIPPLVVLVLFHKPLLKTFGVQQKGG